MIEAANLITELLEENGCNFNKNSTYLAGALWKFRAVTKTGNIMCILLENDTIINFQINNGTWRTYSLEDPNSLDEVIEALEVSLALD